MSALKQCNISAKQCNISAKTGVYHASHSQVSNSNYSHRPPLILWSCQPACFSVSSVLTPLRPLLSSRNDFLWTPVHDEAFSRAKQVLTTAPTLAYFDPTKDTYLHTDASMLGLGFLLMQKSNDSDWNLVQAGSRFLTDAESRYAVIELKCLAVAWAIKKCNIFLAGIDHFTVVTHRLDEIENPRLQRLRTRLMAYNFTARWQKGSKHEAADALSCSPHSSPNQNAEQEANDQGET